MTVPVDSASMTNSQAETDSSRSLQEHEVPRPDELANVWDRRDCVVEVHQRAVRKSSFTGSFNDRLRAGSDGDDVRDI